MTKPLIWFVLFGAVIFTGCGERKQAHEAHVYTCPMHPSVIRNEPGKCPVCGMDLVLQSHSDTDSTTIPHESKVLTARNVKAIKAQHKAMPIAINAQGIVTYDTRFVFIVPTRVGGRLEMVSTKFEYQTVSKGEKLGEIYSPELVTAQREYLLVLDGGDSQMTQVSKNKLLVLGMTEDQIKRLTQSREVMYRFPVYSGHTGYVVSSEAAVPVINLKSSSSSSGMAMGGATSEQKSSSSTTSGKIVREGEYVQPGQALVKIVSNQALRIELYFPGTYAGLIGKGESITLDFGSGHSHGATIDFVEPFFSEGQEFLRVRVYTSNMKNMHIGHLVDAKVSVQSESSWWVPHNSVINLGDNHVLYIKQGEEFVPRKVVAGVESEGWIQIKDGISGDDSIAANAGYFLDSDSFIKLKEELK